ncbi:MAG TPA: DUF4252 domain-containing protein [Candidatus Krumholzibacteria bacterium]|nr:DUF4252 domain-containing protein [Candidatus Krumholzibacteria bacterium]
MNEREPVAGPCRRPTARARPWCWGLYGRSILLGLLLCPSLGATEEKKRADYSQEAGYVDFESLGVFNEEDAIVEIYLHDALLGMVSSMSKTADPELSDMLSKLKLVRVQKFEMSDAKGTEVETKVSGLASKLEKGGWMRAVRVREADENVYVYFKMGEKLLQGITVMAIEADGKATFVNIVGEIDPEQIGRLGKKFDIDELHDLKDWEHRAKDKVAEEPKKKEKDQND